MKAFDWFFIVAVCLIITFTATGKSCYSDGYKSGTIDAMTGHPGYVLTTQPTGETVWVKK